MHSEKISVDSAKTKINHLELLDTVVNAPLVLVDIRPGRPRCTKRRDVSGRRLRNSVEAHEHTAKERVTIVNIHKEK